MLSLQKLCTYIVGRWRVNYNLKLCLKKKIVVQYIGIRWTAQVHFSYFDIDSIAKYLIVLWEPYSINYSTKYVYLKEYSREKWSSWNESTPQKVLFCFDHFFFYTLMGSYLGAIFCLCGLVLFSYSFIQ